MVQSLHEFDTFVEETAIGLEIKINKGDNYAFVAVLKDSFLFPINQRK
jgi:hypothetical protein